jgi:YegS/Rv2252/BmrU family lipid kinase
VPAFTLIVNPAAGNGRAAHAGPEVARLLAAHGCEATLLRSGSLAEAGDMAREAAAAARVAVAIGGDGLVGRMAGALAHTGGVLGIVPCGRGNDVARFLGVSSDLAAACHVLRAGTERRIDLAEVDGFPYASIASAGIDSAVNAIARRTKVLGGRAVYTYAALRALAVWRPAQFVLDVGGERISYAGYSFAAANTTTYGGGMVLAPGARTDDALLDVVTLRDVPKLRALRLLPLMYRGTHVRDPGVSVVQAPRVTVEADLPFVVYADGEPVTELPATFTALPQALRVLTPGLTGTQGQRR